MMASNAYGGPVSGWLGELAVMPSAARCAVHLVDRRTGRPHRVDGAPLVIHTRDPRETAARMLAGRDPAVWSIRITPLSPEGWP